MMNYLKRRFSSGDLQGELDDNEPEQENKLISTITKRIENTNLNMSFISNSDSNANSNTTNISNIISNIANATRKASTKGPSPSAPSSPTKNTSFADSVLNAARVMMNNSSSQSQSTTNSSGNNYPSTGSKFSVNKEKVKILLVIDDDHTDWSKYFKNRRLNGEFDIRVEQAEFKDINLAAYTNTGVMVDLNIIRNGTRVVRSFKPDFVLIRQNVRDADVDWKNIIIGLQYGNVPSINSLHSIYNFIDRAWVFSELVKINQRLGNDIFPLINQAYYPNHKEMLTSSTFPCVMKIGNAHQGLGKVRVQTPYEFQDLSSVVAISNCYSTTEPFIDTKCDIQIQKIGNQYKAFMRKSITNQWKANTGSAMLEQIQMNDRYLKWIEEVGKMFGGLDMCAVKGVIDHNSKEYITQVNDSAFSFLGESQEEDRKLIAELIIEKMTTNIKPQSMNNEMFKSNITQVQRDQNQISNNDFNKQNVSSVSLNNSPQTSFSAILSNRQLPNVPNRQTASPIRLNSQQVPPESSQIKSTTQNNSPINAINSSQNNNNNNKAVGLSTPSTSSSSIASIQSSSSTSKTTPKPPVNNSLPGPPSGQITQSQGRLTLTQNSSLSSQSQIPLQSRPMQQQPPPRPPQQQQKMSVSQNSRPIPQNPSQRPNITQNSDDGDDTMKNLRKTFAGIFGDM